MESTVLRKIIALALILKFKLHMESNCRFNFPCNQLSRAKNIHVGDLVASGVDSKYSPVYYVVHHNQIYVDGITLRGETTDIQLTPSHILSINGEMKKVSFHCFLLNSQVQRSKNG